ncbi:MAG TPA: PaeR7I family type II restriction endonuclease [Candidatus Sulfotelmatobacter sp.]|nr:PaeR7I family type II restriction endonuclease [Candidatus Sulfotelmatobacter sp.]
MKPQLDLKLRSAVTQFWSSRETQMQKQGTKTGVRDAGARAAVTGGSQMDGFVALVRDLLEESGVDRPVVYCERHIELPGWFRPEKKWDLLVVVEGCLIAAIEFKSQVGSFGNNFNNRTEEALGSATDLWAAYREGAFKPSARPWLGYLMLLEDAPASTRPVKAQEPHFKVFEEFKSASYAGRYEILLTKLVRERLYDATCFLMSNSADGLNGQYSEPVAELNFTNFISSLTAKAIACKKTQ